MIEKISVPVSVSLYFDHKKGLAYPTYLLWEGKPYKITKVGLQHKYNEGSTLFHIFSVVGEDLFFRLTLNTTTLHWRLEEISDGNI